MTDRIWIGADPHGLGFEVALVSWSGSSAPSQAALRSLHASRLRSRAIPLCVVAYSSRGTAWILGPVATAPALGPIPEGHAARLLQAALLEGSATAARARILHAREALETAEIPGFDSQGLFAIRELTYGVPRRPDWAGACDRSRALMATTPRGVGLVRSLGFDSHTIAGNALLLTVGDAPPRAVAILLRDDEPFDAESARFAKSPIYHGLEIARRNNVRWLMVARGPQLRLYPTSPDVGVGRRGATQTYFGLDLALLDDEHAGYLELAFSGPALAPGGSVDEILQASNDYAVTLGERLRDRVYADVVPALSTAIARALAADGGLDQDRLTLAYRLTLRIIFRLLFQAYAEDTRLLPLHRNERFTRASLKELARDLAAHPERPHDPRSASLWDGLAQVWRVIDTGDEAWGVPAYNGGLFGSDPVLHPDGAALERLVLRNDAVGPALAGLLVDTAVDGDRGPVDFRSLDVRDFGTVYEGLLEAGLSLASENLTVDSAGAWRPAGPGDAVDAAVGAPYFHTKSGDRKASGSYFTRPFAVEHLLRRSLDPALDVHLEKVGELHRRGDQVGAARLFFDFRVADLAMGSGHFLVAAIGHIEAKFGAFLENNPIPGVERELLELRDAAMEALQRVGVEAPDIDRSALLGRQIARRCIYGLDTNEMAVELGRLALWIRTFVPGLPMSSLDHQLVCANSLTGIGTVDEAMESLDPDARTGALTFSSAAIGSALDAARRVLEDAAALKESTSEESRAAQTAARRALAAAEPARLVFDAAVAVRLGVLPRPTDFDGDRIGGSANTPAVQEALRPLAPAHFPARFPEVFLRERAGFDVVLGNPPWEKVKVEEHSWWALRFPGIRSLSVKEREARISSLARERPDLRAEIESEITAAESLRAILSAGPYPGIGSGDIDLFKAFCWRNWQVLRRGGWFGVLLPRTALSGSGTELWRREILSNGAFEDVCFLTNTKRWAFEQIHPQYTFAMTIASKGAPGRVRFSGPFHSELEYVAGRDDPTDVESSEFVGWTGTAAFPLIPTAMAGEVFRKMREQPTFGSDDGFEFRPVRELDATNDRPLFGVDLERPEGDVPVLAGASFNLWNPDFGTPYGFADYDRLTTHLLAKSGSQTSKPSSAFAGLRVFEPADLPLSRARIAFRDIARPTDTRTSIVVLLPPRVSVVHNAPYLLRRAGTERDEAFLLGVMSSIPFDWYARRVVELHMTFEVLRPMPVPRPRDGDKRRERVVEIAGCLGARDERFAEWAAAVGVPVGSVGAQGQSDLEAELDALVALLYGLSQAHLEHLFATFHRGWRYEERLSRVLVHYRRWAVKDK